MIEAVGHSNVQRILREEQVTNAVIIHGLLAHLEHGQAGVQQLLPVDTDSFICINIGDRHEREILVTIVTRRIALTGDGRDPDVRGQITACTNIIVFPVHRIRYMPADL